MKLLFMNTFFFSDNIVPTVTPNNQTIGVGKIVYLQARATGDPISTLTYRWLYQNQQIDPLALFPSIYVNAENTLVVNATKMTLSELKKWTGMYFVDISSSVETVRLNATVLLPGETIGEFRRPAYLFILSSFAQMYPG